MSTTTPNKKSKSKSAALSPPVEPVIGPGAKPPTTRVEIRPEDRGFIALLDSAVAMLESRDPISIEETYQQTLREAESRLEQLAKSLTESRRIEIERRAAVTKQRVESGVVDGNQDADLTTQKRSRTSAKTYPGTQTPPKRPKRV